LLPREKPRAMGSHRIRISFDEEKEGTQWLLCVRSSSSKTHGMYFFITVTIHKQVDEIRHNG
jgi:hypothetical protein